MKLLRGMKLISLYLPSGVDDISILSKMPLMRLRIELCANLKDLTPLKRCTTLTYIRLTPKWINKKSMEMLRKMKNLKQIVCRSSVNNQPAEVFWKNYFAGKYGKPLITENGNVAEKAKPKPPATGKLAEMWEYAVDYAEKNPGKPDQIIANLTKVKNAGKGSKYELMADSKIKKLKNLITKKNDFLNSIASLLISGKPKNAYKKFNASPNKNSMPELQKILKELSNTNKIILNSFKNDIGKRLQVGTVKGRQTMKITRIKGMSVYVEKKSGSAIFQKKLSIKSLSTREKIKRLGAMSKWAKAVYMGTYAVRGKQYIAAKKYFKRSGVLAPSLLHQLTTFAAKITIGKAIKKATVKFATAKKNAYSYALRIKAAKAALRLLSDLSDKSDLSDYLSPADKRRIATLRSEIAKLAATLKPPGPEKDSPWTVPEVGMEFVWIKALNCWVGKYEVTNGEYRKFKANHNSKEYKGQTLNKDRQPVVYVNFDDAQEYAKWLTKRERDAGRLPSGYQYRLPTKDEWTAFCQCGDDRKYPWGDNWPPKSGHAGNYHGTSGAKSGGKIAGYNDGFAVTCPVESSWENKWGVYGVGGNVWELTRKSANDSSFDSWRGASWDRSAENYLRSSCRGDRDASGRFNGRGFRLVLSP